MIHNRPTRQLPTQRHPSWRWTRGISGTREMQTISSELFNDERREWTWNADDYLRELKSIHEEIEGQYA